MVKLKSSIHLIIMTIVFIIVGYLYYLQYINILEIIESEYNSKIDLVEQSIYNETKYTEVISDIVEQELYDIMKQKSEIMIKKYQENPDVQGWDLERMKEQLDNLDIYIIDEDLEVILSSVKEDIGIDFKSQKEFSTVLKNRLEGDVFKSDTVNFSILRGELKKYSYIPTPDNKYLLELSITIDERYPELKSLNIIHLVKSLKDKYSFVDDIWVYKYNNDKKNVRKLDTSANYEPNPVHLKNYKEEYVKRALESNQVQEQIVKDKDNTYTYKYIPYITNHGEELNWWGSYVIKIVYNDSAIIKEIQDQKNLFLKGMFIVLIIYFILMFIISYLLKKNKEMSNYDHLTKLPNRKKFDQVARYKISKADKNHTKLAVIFFDVDKFKKINDTLGHDIGDKVLKQVVKKIESIIPKGDIIARFGGDEFVAIISNINSKDEIIKIIESILETFKDPVEIESIKISTGVSIGVSIYPNDADTIERLIFKADKAMYTAKNEGKGYRIYVKDE